MSEKALSITAIVLSAVAIVLNAASRVAPDFLTRKHNIKMNQVEGLRAAIPDVRSLRISIGQVSGIRQELGYKADVEHTHGIEDIGGLKAALDGKARKGSGEDGKFTVADIEGLQELLDAKADKEDPH